jgi:hypothetical protein
MKAEVGQWIRSCNFIYQVEKIRVFGGKNQVVGTCKGAPIKSVCTDFDEIEQVANTPQELVQTGDLIETNNIPRPHYVQSITGFDGKYLEYNQLYRVHRDDITAIYTPNKNKTQYTEQWRKGE